VQILWVNLVEDSLPGVALAFEAEEREIMKEPPRPRHEPILNMELKTLIFIIGVVTDLILLFLFYWLQRGFLHLHYIQTVMFVALGIDSLFVALACRSLRKLVIQKEFFSNRFLLAALGVSFLMLAAAVYWTPLQTLLRTHALGADEWALLFGLGLFNLLAIETAKWIFIVRHKKELKVC
jgi:Ca2+-transporting ATPase